MTIKYYGHSCFGITVSDVNLLFDPYISENELAQDVKVHEIPADYIFISHGHSDHIGDALIIAKRTKATIIGCFEVVEWLKKQGAERIQSMNIGGSCQFDFGTVKCVTAAHSSRMPDGSYGGVSVGFVVHNADSSFYFAGDTGLTLDMQLIPMTCPSLSFAILPIGSIYTMDYNDAIIASDFIQCNTVIGCHYDTFDDIKIDHDAAKKAFEDEGKDLILAKIGGELQWS